MAIPRRVTRLIVVALVLGGLLHLLLAGGITHKRYAFTNSKPQDSQTTQTQKDAPQEPQVAVGNDATTPDTSHLQLTPPERQEIENQAHEDVTKQEQEEAIKKLLDTPEHKLYARAFSAFYDQRPQRLDIPKFDKYGEFGGFNEEKLKKERLTEARLRKFLQIEPKHVEQMTELHKNLVDELDRVLDDFGDLSKIYKGMGIAVVAGGRFMPIAINSLRMLRRTGCTLPVEVFLANQEEYEVQLCEEIFPALGAKCRVLPDVLGKAALRNFPLKGYQFKVLSALASSFEHVLLLDADNIAIKDPTAVFKSEVYKKYGYILWPDYWERSTHPEFFTIAGTTLGGVRDDVKQKSDDNEAPKLADLMGALPNPSTESGQVFVNKSAKFKSLLLATYYNLNGPRYYYPLFSQGMMGEGDKETFLAAAVVLDEPVYQVPRHVQAIGRWYKDSFYGAAMLQFDPIKTYELYGKEAKGEIDGKTRSKLVDKEGMFMHTNFPKMNPYELMKKKLLRDSDGNRFRAFGTKSGLNGFVPGRDLELEIWQEAEWMTCRDIKFATWKDADREKLCSEVAEQVDFMMSTTDK
ncbi:Alpha-1,2-mannosyltransferase MNN21 [Yarrowia sp. C11]|nr:Alpha-1,2-mannosyltransferase MNN21 [Yarrowia sp. E02]KAG5369666.1 Alpha-1,2-mannosyltransferase MNN21 [Yarrowia sp. C11]